jgi:RNA polymerase sigma-54 factor
MGLDLRLDAKMSQSLVMSPRMQQAIALLQFNHLEMVTAITEAVLENPTLEAMPSEAPPEVIPVPKDRAADATGDGTDGGGAAESGIDWEKFLEQMADRKGPSSLGGTIHDELPPIEANLTYGESLAEHLLFQLNMVRLTDEEHLAAETLVQNLDERGYLVSTIDEIAAVAECTPEDVEYALGIVQSLDPVGCGARDLAECLILQARLHFPADDTFERILTSHLPNLERRNYAAIAKDLGLDIEDVVEYHKMIQELEPHPGRNYSNDEPQYITPDVFVEKHGDDWVIMLNEDGIPDLKISTYYQKILRGAGTAKADKQYLLDKLRGAEFLIKSINKRRRTIRRVMESILKFQGEFFEQGVGHLRPMVLQDVASDIGVHMSTVSRVTTNKWVHTPHGIFELKYFFSAAVRQSSGEDIAAEAIKSKIKTLVRAENQKKPLSDQQIADHLKKEGLRVARRTVAKYREAMGILPSSQRKSSF